MIGQFHGVMRPQTPIGSLAISVRAAQFLELVVLQHVERGLQVPDAHRGLRLLRQRDRRAHFLGDRRGHVGIALLVLGDDAFEQRDALGHGGLRIAGKGLARRLHGPVDIGRRTHRDAPGRLLGGRVDDVDALGRDRIDPGPVDVELQIVAHGFVLLQSGWPGGQEGHSRCRCGN